MIRLFTSYYPEEDPARIAEYVECLRRNVACAPIDEICVLVESEAEFLPRSGKLRTRTVTERPTYAEYFDWIGEVAATDDVSVIANGDIYFDSQLALFAVWKLPSRTALALSRWDITAEGSARLYDHNDSQDAWIFRGPVEGVFGDFPVGVPRCDNRVAHELERGGYSVENPSFSIRSYHLHAGQRGSYARQHQPGFVPPPYTYFWPHNLWPLHRTVWHNVRHPDSRVGWRLDRRRWHRRLKTHWFQRTWHYLTGSSRRSDPSS